MHQIGQEHRQSRFVEIVNTLSTFVITNLLWLICSIPLITLPAATAGLFAVTVPWVRDQSPEPLGEFFHGMRRYWWKSTLIMLINLVVGGIATANVLILGRAELSPIVVQLSLIATGMVALLMLITNIYLWPLLVLVDFPLTSLIRNAVRLAMAHFAWSLLVLLLAMLPIVLSIVLPQIVLVIATFTTIALIVSWGAWRIIRRYLKDEDNPVNAS